MNKQKKYAHLNQTKRDRIQALLDSGHEQQEIAIIVGAHKSTISREVRRNQRAKTQVYESSVAHHKAYWRRYNAKWRWKKINQDVDLKTYIIEKLKQYWNPDEIAGTMRKEHRPFYASKTAIYEWLRSGRGAQYCPYLYSGRHTVKPRKKNKTKRVLIPRRISILERPWGATNKTRYGHWEGDTIVSGKKTASTSAISVVYERKARFIDARKIPNLKPDAHTRALRDMLHNKKALSVSEDNGIENTRHYELGVPTYFCDPYSSWQKGGVENANKMIRRFIPKKSDLAGYSEKYLARVIDILNHKPRRSLNYQTPYEVMVEHNLLSNKKTEVALQG